MARAVFRFQRELNDLLPREWRGREVVHAFNEPVSVKDRIEAHGVPHTEVELIQSEFRECPDCRRVFWDGSHVRRMRGWVDAWVKRSASGSSGR